MAFARTLTSIIPQDTVSTTYQFHPQATASSELVSRTCYRYAERWQQILHIGTYEGNWMRKSLSVPTNINLNIVNITFWSISCVASTVVDEKLPTLTKKWCIQRRRDAFKAVSDLKIGYIALSKLPGNPFFLNIIIYTPTQRCTGREQLWW